MSVAGIQVTLPVLTLGVITGITYGLLGVGLVLVYRANRVVNFAHGEIGAVSAAMLGLAVVRWHVPYWVAFVLAMGLSAGIGAIAEVAVIRRLRRAPAIMSVVATLGVAEFLLLFSFAANRTVGGGKAYPSPPGVPAFNVGALFVTRAYSAMLFLSPVLVVALVAFFRWTRFGIAVRAAAANSRAARASGIYVARMSTLSWALAGALSAFTAILVLPSRGFTTAESLGPSLLVRALVPAVIARMTSLPATLIAGVAVGVLEQELLWNFPQGGAVQVMLFAIIVVALVAQRRRTGRGEERRATWATLTPWHLIPEKWERAWAVRNIGWLCAGAGAAIALVAAMIFSSSVDVILATMVCFSIIGLSVGIVTGLGGELSLGQFALAGVGAMTSYVVYDHTANLVLGLVAGAAAGGAISLVVALPAIRIRGLMLAVTTLAFAVAAQDWLFGQEWALGTGRTAALPHLFGTTLDTGRKYYVFSLIALALALWIARCTWRGGVGRQLRGLRDNEEAARAFTVPAVRVKLQAFVLSGVLAGLGGAVYGHLLSGIEAKTFPVSASIDLVALTVLGGLGLLTGPLLGALYIVGVPRFLPLDSAGLAATSFGWLVLILYAPGGLAQLLAPLRRWSLRRLAGTAATEAEVDEDAEPVARIVLAAGVGRTEGHRVANPSIPVLEVRGLTRRFGGITAVDDVSFEVAEGQTVGVIGPNGAGKTTLFELVSGFTRPDAGSVVFAGRDVSRLSAEARGRLGLVRSFQDAALFPTLTVLETIQLSLHRQHPTPFARSVLGLDGGARRSNEQARTLAAALGLDRFRRTRIAELSTGTRRMVEIACLVGLAPRLLLLDEPSSGIAQRETEALGAVLDDLKTQLSATLVIIEHDIPLVMGLADRIVVLAAGRLIADGTPAGVRSDDAVIDAYLGRDESAVARSGPR